MIEIGQGTESEQDVRIGMKPRAPLPWERELDEPRVPQYAPRQENEQKAPETYGFDIEAGRRREEGFLEEVRHRRKAGI
jgi:hypothetical protein